MYKYICLWDENYEKEREARYSKLIVFFSMHTFSQHTEYLRGCIMMALESTVWTMQYDNVFHLLSSKIVVQMNNMVVVVLINPPPQKKKLNFHVLAVDIQNRQ